MAKPSTIIRIVLDSRSRLQALVRALLAIAARMAAPTIITMAIRSRTNGKPSNPLHTWYTPPHTLAQIQGYLGSTYNAGQCGTLTAFDLSDRDASDRLNHVRMVGSTGVCTVTPGAFIRAINAGSPADFVVYGEMFGVTPGSHAWRYW